MFKIGKSNRSILIKVSEINILDATIRKSFFLNVWLIKVKINTNCFVFRDTSINIKWTNIKFRLNICNNQIENVTRIMCRKEDMPRLTKIV